MLLFSSALASSPLHSFIQNNGFHGQDQQVCQSFNLFHHILQTLLPFLSKCINHINASQSHHRSPLHKNSDIKIQIISKNIQAGYWESGKIVLLVSWTQDRKKEFKTEANSLQVGSKFELDSEHQMFKLKLKAWRNGGANQPLNEIL